MNKRIVGCVLAIVIACCCVAAERQQAQSSLQVRMWSYGRDQTLTVQFGNPTESAVHIDDIGAGDLRNIVGCDVEALKTLVARTSAKTEPCAVILWTNQGKFIFELEPQLRR